MACDKVKKKIPRIFPKNFQPQKNNSNPDLKNQKNIKKI